MKLGTGSQGELAGPLLSACSALSPNEIACVCVCVSLHN